MFSPIPCSKKMYSHTHAHKKIFMTPSPRKRLSNIKFEKKTLINYLRACDLSYYNWKIPSCINQASIKTKDPTKEKCIRFMTTIFKMNSFVVHINKSQVYSGIKKVHLRRYCPLSNM